jgi:hypothetical protein
LVACKAGPATKAEALPERHTRGFLACWSEGILIPPGSAVTVTAKLCRRSLSMTGRALLLASAVVAALAALPAGTAGAASLLEKNFYLSGPQYEGKLPPCDYRDALSMIASRFNQKENMYWATDLRIVNFERIRETAFRPWAANAIPRRFCSGVVEVTDGRKHAIHYSISEDTGMIGASWGIEWCVVGLDRNWSYNPACKMALP